MAANKKPKPVTIPVDTDSDSDQEFEVRKAALMKEYEELMKERKRKKRQKELNHLQKKVRKLREAVNEDSSEEESESEDDSKTKRKVSVSNAQPDMRRLRPQRKTTMVKNSASAVQLPIQIKPEPEDSESLVEATVEDIDMDLKHWANIKACIAGVQVQVDEHLLNQVSSPDPMEIVIKREGEDVDYNSDPGETVHTIEAVAGRLLNVASRSDHVVSVVNQEVLQEGLVSTSSSVINNETQNLDFPPTRPKYDLSFDQCFVPDCYFDSEGNQMTRKSLKIHLSQNHGQFLDSLAIDLEHFPTHYSWKNMLKNPQNLLFCTCKYKTIMCMEKRPLESFESIIAHFVDWHYIPAPEIDVILARLVTPYHEVVNIRLRHCVPGIRATDDLAEMRLKASNVILMSKLIQKGIHKSEREIGEPSGDSTVNLAQECVFCDFIFATRHQLAQHIKSFHSEFCNKKPNSSQSSKTIIGQRGKGKRKSKK